MVNQKQNFTKEEEDIIAIGTAILFILFKLGILSFLVYIIFQIVSIIRP
jgi:hypothetical protein